jgi:hypothetical protein
MRFLNDFKKFEAIVFGNSDFTNSHLIEDLKDMMLELEDEGMFFKIWINGIRFGKGVINKQAIERVEIEIYRDGYRLGDEDSIDIFDFLFRIKDYLKDFNVVYYKPHYVVDGVSSKDKKYTNIQKGPFEIHKRDLGDKEKLEFSDLSYVFIEAEKRNK